MSNWMSYHDKIAISLSLRNHGRIAHSAHCGFGWSVLILGPFSLGMTSKWTDYWRPRSNLISTGLILAKKLIVGFLRKFVFCDSEWNPILIDEWVVIPSGPSLICMELYYWKGRTGAENLTFSWVHSSLSTGPVVFFSEWVSNSLYRGLRLTLLDWNGL